MRITEMKLRASTLVETLVMMIVAGMVFLLVTEGLGMFKRLQGRLIAAMESDGRIREGVYRLESLAESADSMKRAGTGVIVYRNGAETMLRLSDSVLIYSRDDFVDTIMTGVERLKHAEYDDGPDTLKVTIRKAERTFTARFGIRQNPQVEYMREINRIENEQ